MLPDERDAAYLLDMQQAGEKARRYVKGKSFADYEHDDQLRDAVERNIEIIGEAARKVSEAFKREHPEIPWRKIIAQRNVLVHEYEAVNHAEIWEVVSVHVPALLPHLKPLIPPLPPEERGA